MTARSSDQSSRPTAPRRSPSTWVALGLVLLTAVMIGYIAIANAMPGTEQLPYHSDGPLDTVVVLATVAAWLSILLTGFVLTALRPRNPIGWLLLVSGFSIVYTYFAPEYVLRADILDWALPGYRLVDWILPVFETLGIVVIDRLDPTAVP